MTRAKLLLDTNVVIDFLSKREPFYQKARLMMIAGKVGEFQLWLSASQMTDVLYILSDGGPTGHMPRAIEQIRGLRTFVNVYPAGEAEIDAMLAADWTDPEDALIHEIALSLGADAIITRNEKDFERSLLPVFDCEDFFAWAESKWAVRYEEAVL